MNNIENIREDLESAKTIRTELLADLGDSYNPDAMEQIQLQQQRIAALTSELAEAEAKAVAEAAASVSEDATGGGSGMALVALLSGGKRDKTLQVPAGARLGDVLAEIGWDSGNYTFKRRIGVGQSATLTDGLNYILTEGTHEISMVPAVEAG
jgi:hypothetical protein